MKQTLEKGAAAHNPLESCVMAQDGKWNCLDLFFLFQQMTYISDSCFNSK